MELYLSATETDKTISFRQILKISSESINNIIKQFKLKIHHLSRRIHFTYINKTQFLCLLLFVVFIIKVTLSYLLVTSCCPRLCPRQIVTLGCNSIPSLNVRLGLPQSLPILSSLLNIIIKQCSQCSTSSAADPHLKMFILILQTFDYIMS